MKRTLSSFISAGLKDEINHTFGQSTVRSTANHFLEMTLASKFGTGNALAEGGQGFLKETCIKVFNEFIRDGRATQYPKGAFYGGTYSMTNLSNASFLFNVDAALFSHIGKLDVFFPWITDAELWEHDTEGKCLSWITGEQRGWPNSILCNS